MTRRDATVHSRAQTLWCWDVFSGWSLMKASQGVLDVHGEPFRLQRQDQLEGKLQKERLNHSGGHLTSGTGVDVIVCCKNLAVNRCFWTRQLTQWLINHARWPDCTCSCVTLEWRPGRLWKNVLALGLTQEVIYSLTRWWTLFLRNILLLLYVTAPYSYNQVPRQSTKTIPLLDCVSINYHNFMFSLYNIYIFELRMYVLYIR